ncbi:MAG: argininosuccinate synthase [Chloroflexota bacterium]
MMDKVILAYSGGLDTSVAIKWLHETYNLEVICVTVDVGNERDFESIQEKALRTGATKAYVHDAKQDFVKYFVWPSLRAGTIYEGQYPLATALARPLIAKILVDYAIQEGATHIAHGCTGKGNDQVRFDVSINALAPDMKIVAPVREWRWTREEEILYAQEHNIPVPVTVGSPYSVDQNLWGRSVEAGVLEDPWAEPPEDVYAWTMGERYTPAEPSYVEIEFEHGVPVALDGDQLDGPTLVARLNDLAGSHGIGRIDHVENRYVGIKSREIYECPAAVVLHDAHAALETMTLTRDQMRFKQIVSNELATLIYNGFWFSAHTQDLMSYVASTQRFASGTVRVKLFRGKCAVVGRKAEHSLYNEALATYGQGDLFDHAASIGFIKIAGMAVTNQAQSQLLLGSGATDRMMRLAAGQTADEDDAVSGDAGS